MFTLFTYKDILLKCVIQDIMDGKLNITDDIGLKISIFLLVLLCGKIYNKHMTTISNLMYNKK